MSAPIRIAHIIYSGLGGHGSVFSSFVAGDQADTVEPLALFYGIEGLNEDYRAFCETREITYSYISKAPGIDRKSWRLITQQLADWQPDAVIMHSCYTIIPVHRYTKQAGIPLITVEHTANQYKSWKDWLWSFLSMIRSDRMIYLTESYQTEVQQQFKFFFRSKKAAIIPNGIHTGKFSPQPRPDRAEIRIGMHARLGPPKDFHTLIKAFAQVVKTSQDRPFQLRIAGDGVYRPELEALVEELNMGQHIFFEGMLNEAGVIRFLQDLDIYVLSSWGETMSTAVMQAMAVQLPVIVSDIEGTRNMVQEGHTGLFFTNGQIEDLSKQMLRLVEDTALRREIAQHARKFAEENFSHIRMFARYQAVFLPFIQKHKAEKANT